MGQKLSKDLNMCHCDIILFLRIKATQRERERESKQKAIWSRHPLVFQAMLFLVSRVIILLASSRS